MAIRPEKVSARAKTIEPENIRKGMFVRDSSSNVRGNVVSITEDALHHCFDVTVERGGKPAGQFTFYKPGNVGFDPERKILIR